MALRRLVIPATLSALMVTSFLLVAGGDRAASLLADSRTATGVGSGPAAAPHAAVTTSVVPHADSQSRSAAPARSAVQPAMTTAGDLATSGPHVEHYSWGSAIPISVQGPSWFDSALYQKVVAAGSGGVPLSSVEALQAQKGTGKGAGSSSTCGSSTGAAPTGSAVPDTPQGVERPPVGIGPGTWLISLFCTNVGGTPVPDGFAWCTANFVFQNLNGSFGLGTAGHCGAKGALASPVTAVVTPPPEVCADGGSCQPGLYAIGTFSLVHNNGLGDDFALISIYPQFNRWMRPAMPVFGGPTGSFVGGLIGVGAQTLTAGPITAFTPAYYPAAVGHCGHGVAVGTGGTCRTSAGLFAASTWYAWYGASAPGDSGSGVEILGNYGSPLYAVPACADLTHIIILDANVTRQGHLTEGPDQPGMVAGTQMSTILGMLGSGWKLVNGGLP